LNPPKEECADVWLPMEHPPGFDPNGVSCPNPVLQTLKKLASISISNSNLSWLLENQSDLEAFVKLPFSFTGVIATAFTDLSLTKDQGEMLFLLLRLPGAGVHALEQKKLGWKKYPFFMDTVCLKNDPGEGSKL
jgi:citrate synthase